MVSATIWVELDGWPEMHFLLLFRMEEGGAGVVELIRQFLERPISNKSLVLMSKGVLA